MSNLRSKIALVVCILLHSYVVWNVYEADKFTPRIVNVKAVVCLPTVST